MCIYSLKEIVNSTILMCFIDAFKAFDRVNHKQLFIKLKQRVYCEVSCLLVGCTHQQMHIK